MAEIQSLSVSGTCGEFAFAARSWTLLLALAARYGWQPAGTLPPDPEYFNDYDGDPVDWDGHYFPANGQEMTADDAHRLADALERALADLPDHDALSDKVIADRPARDDGLHLWSREVLSDVSVSPVEEFSGPNKARLRDFIVHCRQCAEFWLC